MAPTRFVALLFALLLGACSSPPTAGPEAMLPVTWSAADRTHQLGDVLLSSQPGPDDLTRAKLRGVKTVVNLRPAAEDPTFDEAVYVHGLGMDYVHEPIDSPATLTDATFDRLRAVLDGDARRPILLHCSSSNRVGPIWIAYRVLDVGVSFEDAEAEARKAGLRVDAYVERAREYVEARQD